MSLINPITERTEDEAGGSELVGDSKNRQVLPSFHLMADGHFDNRAARS